MSKKILQLLSVMLMIFTASLSAMANQEVNLDQPVMETPAEIAGFTYAEGWWDIAPTSASYISVDVPGFTGYTDAGFTLNTQVTTDFNVYSSYSYSQCIWNQNMRLLDMSINELIAMGGGWSSGNTTFGWYDFGPGWGGGSFELMAELSIDYCPMPMPEIAPEPVIINVGFFGLSILKYNYFSTNPSFPGTYFYKHIHSSSDNNCPATCGSSVFVFDTIPVIVTDGHFPGIVIATKIPFGPYGVCSPVGTLQENARIKLCYDIHNN